MSDDFIFRIVTEVQESEEDFIFTTIQPFCEDVIKRKISKAELVKLLSQPKIVRCGECEHLTNDRICPRWERICELTGRGKAEDGYCDEGERRVDDE